MARDGYVWQGGLAGGSYSAPRLLEDSFVLGEAHSQLFLRSVLFDKRSPPENRWWGEGDRRSSTRSFTSPPHPRLGR